MKIITVLNAVLAIMSLICALRAVYFSHLYGFRAKERVIAFLLATDKRRFEKMVRAALYSQCAMCIILLSHQVNRIFLAFPPFISRWVAGSSLLVFLCLFIVSAVSMLAYDEKAATFVFGKRSPNARQ